MTNEQAINCMKSVDVEMENLLDEDLYEAIMLGRNALENKACHNCSTCTHLMIDDCAFDIIKQEKFYYGHCKRNGWQFISLALIDTKETYCNRWEEKQ